MGYLLVAYGAVLVTLTLYAVWLSQRRRALLAALGSLPEDPEATTDPS